MNFDVKFSETDRSFEPSFGMAINFPGGGADGKDGASAYEIAVKNGFEGTEQEWLESLHGEDGKDGYTPVKGVDYFDGKDGKLGADGYSPIRGVDYWTEADKAEMVADVISALPVYNGEVVE